MKASQRKTISKYVMQAAVLGVVVASYMNCQQANPFLGMGSSYQSGTSLSGSGQSLKIIAPTSAFAAGQCSDSFSVSLVDKSGNLSAAADNVNVQLSADAGAQTFTDSNCTSAASQLVITKGLSSQQFFVNSVSGGDVGVRGAALGASDVYVPLMVPVPHAGDYVAHFKMMTPNETQTPSISSMSTVPSLNITGTVSVVQPPAPPAKNPVNSRLVRVDLVIQTTRAVFASQTATTSNDNNGTFNVTFTNVPSGTFEVMLSVIDVSPYMSLGAIRAFTVGGNVSGGGGGGGSPVVVKTVTAACGDSGSAQPKTLIIQIYTDKTYSAEKLNAPCTCVDFSGTGTMDCPWDATGTQWKNLSCPSTSEFCQDAMNRIIAEEKLH